MIDFLFKKKIFSIILFVFLIISGVFSYFQIPRNEDPGYKIRTCAITATLTGISPIDADNFIAKKIEEELQTIPEIENIRSKSREGFVVVYADVWDYYADLQPIWDKIRRRMEKVQPNLPQGTSIFVNDEFGDVFGFLVGVKSKESSYSELIKIADNFKQEFLRLNEGAKVEIYGEQNKTIYLNYKKSGVEKYKLNSQNIKNYLEKTNIITSGGELLFNENEIKIYFRENFRNIDDVKNTYIETVSGEIIKLDDIFEIQEKTEEPAKNIVLIGDENGLVIGISMKDKGNIFKLSKEINNTIKKLKNEYPIGVDIELIMAQSEYVEYLTSKFTSSLLQSVVIVIAILLFILGLKTGFLVGGLIPITIASAIFFMNKFGIGLEKISLSALIISLGILVDNSIVISEGYLKETEKRINLNLKEKEEIIKSVCKKFISPLLISTTITSLAFAPTFFAKSSVGEYTSSLFKVVAITLYISLFISIGLIPILIIYFLKQEREEKKLIKPEKYFIKILKYSAKKPKKTLLFGFYILAISFLLFNFVPKIFFPDSDRPTYEIKIVAENSNNIYETEKITKKILSFIRENIKTKNTTSFIGVGAPRYVLSATPESEKANYGLIIVNIEDYRNVDEDIKKIQNWADENFANAEIIARKVPLGPPYNAPVEVRILGDDIQKLMKFRDIGKEELRKIKNVILVNDDWGEKISNIKIKVEKANILRRGLNVQTLSNSINASTKGFNVSNFIDNNNDNVSINIRLNEGIRQNSENLKTIQIYSEKLKNTIPLSEIASLEVNYDYPEIIRRNGQYSITIEGYINKNKTTSKKVVEKLMKKLKKLELPAGYRFEVGGIVENSNKGMKAVMAEMPLVIGLCGIILITYFNSIKNTLIIVLTGILALSGANLGLFITHSYFGFMTFLGYISLLGMACNNSVVLIDYFEENLKDKIKTKNKIILLTLKRIRPISLTALTTIAGMLPLWLSNDPMFSSMAIAIIFGLITSILSTIILAPTLYLVFNKIK